MTYTPASGQKLLIHFRRFNSSGGTNNGDTYMLYDVHNNILTNWLTLLDDVDHQGFTINKSEGKFIAFRPDGIIDSNNKFVFYDATTAIFQENIIHGISGGLIYSEENISMVESPISTNNVSTYAEDGSLIEQTTTSFTYSIGDNLGALTPNGRIFYFMQHGYNTGESHIYKVNRDTLTETSFLDIHDLFPSSNRVDCDSMIGTLDGGLLVGVTGLDPTGSSFDTFKVVRLDSVGSLISSVDLEDLNPFGIYYAVSVMTSPGGTGPAYIGVLDSTLHNFSLFSWDFIGTGARTHLFDMNISELGAPDINQLMLPGPYGWLAFSPSIADGAMSHIKYPIQDNTLIRKYVV